MPGRTRLDAVAWPVGHGSAVSVRLPHGAVIMLYCGPPSDACSSPALATLRHWGRIDALSISHPDMDHMGDIRNAVAARPRLLIAPDVPVGQVLKGKGGSDRLTALYYLDLKGRCRLHFGPLPLGGTRVEWFSLGGRRGSANEYSVVTFLQRGWFTLLHAGDLPSGCWADLLGMYGIRLGRLLLQTNFFVMPHHGRSDAYDPGLMGFMNLQLGIASDRSEEATSAISEYGRHFEEWLACNARTGDCGRKNVLTTRRDDLVKLRAVFDGRFCKQVLVGLGGRHG